MARRIQIRNVPEEIHRKLKARAAMAGMSMSEFILRELRKTLEHPTREEILDRLAKLPPVKVDPTPAEAVRAERDSR